MGYEADYLDLLEEVRSAVPRGDRTGTGTRSIFGYQMLIGLTKEFPLLTTKKVNFWAVFHELKWMLMGETNIKYLVDNGVNIWNDWPLKRYDKETGNQTSKEDFIALIKSDAEFAREWGDCGPVYGYQWRKWWTPTGGIDQIWEVLETLKTNPESRRMIVSAWNVAEIPAMIPSGLPPCHLLMQFYTRETASGSRFLDCMMTIRSNDLFLGMPFNMAQYALLVHLMAKTANMMPGVLVYSIGDAHIYLNHTDQVDEQLQRSGTKGPKLRVLVQREDPAQYLWEDLELIGYNPQGAIKADIAV
jgi:thymidylate synthase